MTKIYFTLTRTRYYYGSDFLKSGMKIQLEKEPDNKYDPEAIQVKLKGMGSVYNDWRKHECRKNLRQD